MLEQVLQRYPLDVPEHAPLRYCPDEQLLDEHVLQRYPLEVPLQEPLRYWPLGQLTLEQVAHALLVVDEQAWVWYVVTLLAA